MGQKDGCAGSRMQSCQLGQTLRHESQDLLGKGACACEAPLQYNWVDQEIRVIKRSRWQSTNDYLVWSSSAPDHHGIARLGSQENHMQTALRPKSIFHAGFVSELHLQYLYSTRSLN